MQSGIANKLDRASKFIEIDGVKMHYVEMGTGRPILFLHTIPLSSHVWHNMVPHLSTMGRCIALDLIGCGLSERPLNITYSIYEHIHYVERFIEKLHLNRIVLVMHGVGSVIGLDIAMRQEANFSGLVFYESFIRPVTPDDVSLPYKEHLLALQHESTISPSHMHAKEFIDHLVNQLSIGDMTATDKKCYTETFHDVASLEPVLEYLRELPTGDGLNHIDHVIAKYFKQLAKSTLPKLMLYSLPGFITSIATVMWAKEHVKRLEVIELGEELHLANITYGKQMSEMISIWLQGIEQSGG